jgi:hypothetical protein
MINFANEKLHAHYLFCVFEMERDEYALEGIAHGKIDAVTFADNSACLELIESAAGLRRGGAVSSVAATTGGGAARDGILQILDAEVTIGKSGGSDAHFLQLLMTAFDPAATSVKKTTGAAAMAAAAAAAGAKTGAGADGSSSGGKDSKTGGGGGAGGSAGAGGSHHPYFARVLSRPDSFVVKHFCGDVAYCSDGFTVKNRDKLNDSLSTFLATSAERLIADLFNPDIDICAREADGGGADTTSLDYLLREEKRKKELKTVASSTIEYQFRTQINTLMDTLRSSQ